MPVLNLAGVIDSLGTGDVVIERALAPVTVANGKATVRPPTTITVKACVQVASARDLARLPENDRTRETIIIFTKVPLEVSSPATGKQGDVIRYAERRYEVTRREDWCRQSGHHRCYAAKIEGDR